MNKKKLNKTVWYSSELDVNKKPILPPIADSPTDLNGLHEGEIFLHNSDEDPSIWIRTSSGKIQRLKGTGENISFWELMTDESGNKYIFTKYHLVTQFGMTMYSGEDGLNLPSIYDGLPIDSQTIYWEDIKDGNGVVIGKILKAKTGGGTLGSLTNVGEWADSVADVDRIMVQKKGSDTWEAMAVSGIGSASFENISESGEGNAYTSFELSEDKKFLTLVKGETFALASDLEDKWTTDEELINNWNTAFGWGNHAEAGYALQASLDLVSEKLNNFLEGSDTDSIINKWKELEAFLDGLSQSDKLAEILSSKANQSALEETNRILATKWTKDDTKIANWDAAFSWGDHSKAGYAAKSYVDSTFVTIAGNEDVTGIHNFTNGLKIGGKLIDKTKDDVIYIDANLVVRGGITMYGDRDANIPSILNSIPTAGYDDIQARGLIAFNSNHFVINNGVVSAIQGSAGLDVEHLEDYLTSNKYATEDWVKQYVVDVNTGNITAITQQMVIDALGFTPYDASNPNGYITSATLDGYLPLSGGTVTGSSVAPLTINSTNSDNKCYIPFTVNGVIKAYVGYSSAVGALLEVPNGVFRVNTTGITYNGNTVYHAGNDGSGSGLDADLLDGKHLSDILASNVASATYATTAGNADTVDGYHIASEGTREHPWGKIPIVRLLDGVMEVGQYIDFHFDTSVIDYSTRIHSKGNHGNTVVLPSANGTLALTSDIPTNTNQLTNGAGFITPSDFNSLGVITTSNYDTYALRADGWLSVDSNDAPRVYRASGVPYINFRKDYNTNYGSLGVNENGQPVWFDDKNGSGWHTLIHSENIGSQSVNYATSAGSCTGNAASATKLSDNTSFTIWGQEFFVNGGPKSVSGDLSGVGRIIRTEPSAVDMDHSGNFIFKNLESVAENYWHIDTADGNPIFVVHNNGNTGIGTINPSHTLHVKALTDAPIYIEQNNSGDWTVAMHVVNGSLVAGQHYNINIGHSATPYNHAWFGYYHAGVGSTSNRLSMGLHSADDVINILGSGNVGIGTTNPEYKLDVNGTIRFAPRTIWGQSFDGSGDVSGNLLFDKSESVGANTTGHFRIGKFDESDGGLKLQFGGTGTNGTLQVINQSWNQSLLKLEKNGNLTIGGNLLTNGGITMYSQRSLKDVVDERGLSLSELSAIKPTRYTWKDGRDSRLHFGGIADDIQQVLPEVVYKTKEGILTMDYGNAGFAIASSLIKPVVDHEQRIKALERENEMLKQELNRLRA